MSQGFLDELRTALPPGIDISDDKIGGGQGVVYRGKCGGKPAAVKLYSSTTDVRRFDREVSALTKINCPFVVKVLHAEYVQVATDRFPLIAFEYLQGGDLSQLILPEAAPVDAQTLARIGLQMGTAVEMLWSHRIVHRDIKPANIMRSGDRFVLVDLGYARHVDRSHVTAPGLACGTSGYMSPEQAQGWRNLTIKSDVFSLGVTLYHVAARHHPFNGLQSRIGMTPAWPLEHYRPDLPNALTRSIDQMLAKLALSRPGNPSVLFEPF